MDAEFLKAIAQFAWPVLAAAVIWKFYPAINQIVRSRAFTLKVGGMEFSVQQGVENLQNEVKDLREQLLLHVQAPGAAAPGAAAPAAVGFAAPPPAAQPAVIRRLLWVDDNPANNAFHIAALKDRDIEVEQALSTAEAMQKLGRGKYDAVVSDMGRTEDCKYNDNAGLDLLQAMTASQIAIPVFYLTARQQVVAKKEKVFGMGGRGITSSPTELFRLLRDYGAPM